MQLEYREACIEVLHREKSLAAGVEGHESCQEREVCLQEAVAELKLVNET